MTAPGKKPKINKVVTAGIWYTLSTFLVRGLSFITTPIFTRLLTKQEYGDYSNFAAWIGIISIVATMDMYTTINRARYDYEDLDEYLSTVALAGSAVTAVFWAVTLVFSDFFTQLFSMDMVYINIMFMSTMVSPALALLQGKHRIHYKYKAYVALSLGSVLLSTAVSLILVLASTNRLFARVIGQYGTLFVFDLLVYIYIIARGRKFRPDICKYAFLICIPMIPHLLSKYILNQSDRIMIKHYCGAEDTALYSLAYNCAMIPVLFGNATNIAWSPWSGEKLHAERYSDIRKASYFYITMMNMIVVFIFLLGPELILILGGRKYADGIYVLAPVVLGASFQFLFNLYVALEQFAKKTVGMGIGTTVAALINVLLNWLLIPRYGYIAAAYTTLFGYFCLLMIHYFLVRRIGYGNVYDSRFNFISLGVLFGLMLIILQLYDKPAAVRYALAAVIAVIGLVALYRKKDVILAKVMNRNR